MSQHTPMVQQYLDIKREYQDALLFFRLGDFYEMFFDDAEIAARELEIVLTARDGGKAGRIPMCGVPHHSASNYIARLINRGYRVAICEQVEDPKQARGLVRREVVRVITPGTVMEDIMLDAGSNNYLTSLAETNGIIGLASIDVSTGEFIVTEIGGKDVWQLVENELQRLNPAECLLPDTDRTLWQNETRPATGPMVTSVDSNLTVEQAQKILCRQFSVLTLEGFGLKDYQAGLIAAAQILLFLDETQKVSLYHIRSLKPYQIDQYLELDLASRRNLELTATIRDGKREGSLLAVLDSCCTAMGRRKLKEWIELPLRDVEEINKRLDAVEELKNSFELRGRIRSLLETVYDLERLAGKIGNQIANPRDLLVLKASLESLIPIKEALSVCTSNFLQEIAQMDPMYDVQELIDQAIDDNASASLLEGNIIKRGYHSEIDELKDISHRGSNWLVEFESQEKERTGIKHLKVGYNKVFGYYIEVSKSNLPLVPGDYIRKQTLVNTERFISEELKQYEEKILGARERLFTLEYQEFLKIREQLSQALMRLQDTAFKVAILDVAGSLAETAFLNDYVRPIVDDRYLIAVKNGRHPVVEKHLQETRFIPNDIKLDQGHRFAIITGPNMGGKSTYMRQVALITLMAQMGSLVPAESAHIGVVDKIFTRVGASDDLASGQSTFMVEMVEVANILNNATRNSLVILDEIGRGTSTYDGLSLAQAVAEYIYTHIGAKTLFATHYHELTSLAEQLDGIVNLCVSVNDTGESVVFLKKVLPGKADKSYGLHVAELAGITRPVIVRAQEILVQLEKDNGQKRKAPEVCQLELFPEKRHPLLDELENLELDGMTPREALKVLYEWKDRLND